LNDKCAVILSEVWLAFGPNVVESLP
jgi:hypothetical protein